MNWPINENIVLTECGQWVARLKYQDEFYVFGMVKLWTRKHEFPAVWRSNGEPLFWGDAGMQPPIKPPKRTLDELYGRPKKKAKRK